MNLHDQVESIFRLSPPQKSALKKLGIETVQQLLFHFPSRYQPTITPKNIGSLQKGDEVTLYGKIRNLKLGKGFRTRISMAEGIIEDQTGTIKVVWFNQPYLAKMLREGSFVRVVGKVSEKRNKLQNQPISNPKINLYLANPDIESLTEVPYASAESLFADGDVHPLQPVYPESRGISSRWFYFALQKIFQSHIIDSLIDPIPEDILNRYHLPSLQTALIYIHAPKKESDALVARKRFAFEEIFYIQLEKMRERRDSESKKAFVIDKSQEEISAFTKRFPFKATSAQDNAVRAILGDFSVARPMSRLLEGDVGSGKTAVAATTAYAAVTTRPRGQDFGTLQVAYMAPTEILATQHFESFIQYFKHLPINIALITGSGCRKFPSKVNPSGWTTISRAQLLKWAAGGEIAILLGTHALIQKSVKFKNLAYIIIDEQHRFGTAQRAKLARKGDIVPHLLSMTATPIPRTLALTIYGDLDLTLLDEMPHGRKQVQTKIVTKDSLPQVYEHIRTQLKEGRQAYIICPRIDEPDPNKELALEAKSVKAEAKRLQEHVFPEFKIEILHSKMKPKEKDEIMEQFKSHKIDILVATSVVEVGVNVPNATNIIIEGAERFGLAQLHQLRGRVIRSVHQPYCFLVSETRSGKSKDRLKALVTAKNGFELSEKDLELRGAGELYGRKQWGISDVGMEAIKNIKMVEAARAEAKRLIDDYSELNKYPLLQEKLSSRKNTLHFE